MFLIPAQHDKARFIGVESLHGLALLAPVPDFLGLFLLLGNDLFLLGLGGLPFGQGLVSQKLRLFFLAEPLLGQPGMFQAALRQLALQEFFLEQFGLDRKSVV